MDCKIIKYFLILFLINFKVFAAEFQGKFIQGHYIIGKTSPGTKVLIDKNYPFAVIKHTSEKFNFDSIFKINNAKVKIIKPNWL